jgi:preprotein translocase subunit YajC
MKRYRLMTMTGLILLAAALLAGPTWAQDDAGDAGSEAPVIVTESGTVEGEAPAEDAGTAATDPDAGEGESGEGQATEGDGQQAPPEDTGPLGGPWFFVIMIGGFILLYWIMGSGRRKQQAKHREMLANLAKGDKVITIGGVVGTAVEVREDEITVKVDDGTRMKFARWAIRSAGEEVQAEKKDNADKK